MYVCKLRIFSDTHELKMINICYNIKQIKAYLFLRRPPENSSFQVIQA